MTKPSNRNRVRDAAEQLLRRSGTPLHHSDIAKGVLPGLGLDGVMSSKDVNTCLHEDPQHRFRRVSRGTWALASTQRPATLGS